MVAKLLQGASAGWIRCKQNALSAKGPLSTAVPLRWSHFWAVLQRTGGSGNLGPLTRVSGLKHPACNLFQPQGVPLRPLISAKVEDLWQRCKRYGFESRAELPLGQRRHKTSSSAARERTRCTDCCRQNFLRHFHGLGALLHFPESVFEELSILSMYRSYGTAHVLTRLCSQARVAT